MRLPLGVASVVVGTDESCDIVVDDPNAALSAPAGVLPMPLREARDVVGFSAGSSSGTA